MAPNAPQHVATTVEEHHHSDTSSSDSASQPEWDSSFNAAIEHPLGVKIFDRFWVIMAQLAQLAYLGWRWHRFLTNQSTLIFSLPFIISETMIVLGGSFITYFMVWNQVSRPKLRLKDLRIPRRDLPKVDIMIPCYNEPVEVRGPDP
jgi:hypothetical protein